MVVRMIEYDFSIALEQALTEGPPYRMEFPASCVLFLRHTSSTPDVLRIEVALPDGGSFEYRTKVVKAQLVSRDEIFRKRLLVLLPYYLIRYENELSRIAGDDELSMRLVAERMEREVREQGLRQGIEQGIEQGKAQGLEQGKKEGHDQAVRELSERLRRLGIDGATIDRAIASMDHGQQD